MKQSLEITKAKAGVTAKELNDVLKFGQDLIGEEYLSRMKETGLLADVSFVWENDGSVYLISYYLRDGERKEAAKSFLDVPVFKQFMEKINPLFEGSTPLKLNAPANSFWIDSAIKECLG